MLSMQYTLEEVVRKYAVFADRQERQQFVCGQCHVIVSRMDVECPHCGAVLLDRVEQ